MTDYGSGALGDWTTMSRSSSTEETINASSVWMFGDSIAKATQKDLAVQLLDKRGQVLAVDTQGGRPTAPSVDVLQTWLLHHAPPPQIIMATGTNDIFEPPGLDVQIERTMELVAGRAQVYWKDVQVCRTGQPVEVQIADQRNTGWVNQQIHAALGRHENLHLIPWFSSLASKLGRHAYYLSDGVHTNATTGVAFHNAVVLNHLV